MIRIKKERNRLIRHLLYKFSDCVRNYNMIRENDRVLICFSGGKDSLVLIDLLKEYQRVAKDNFEIAAIHIDHSIPDFPVDEIEEYLKKSGIEFFIDKQNIYGTVEKILDDGAKACSLCSRLRRGAIYKFASDNNFNKIALGHHMDDVVETLFLNMFYGSKMKAMPPVLYSRDGQNTTIRPMSHIREHEIIRYTENAEISVIDKGFCKASRNLKREEVKEMLKEWQRKFPGRIEKIYTSTKNIEPSLLSDMSLFDFTKS